MSGYAAFVDVRGAVHALQDSAHVRVGRGCMCGPVPEGVVTRSVVDSEENFSGGMSGGFSLKNSNDLSNFHINIQRFYNNSKF
jgi:hypothetical protein